MWVKYEMAKEFVQQKLRKWTSVLTDIFPENTIVINDKSTGHIM